MIVNNSNCVICESFSFSLTLKNGYQIKKCSNCGLEFTDPMPTQKQLADFYSTYVDLRAQSKVSQKNSERNLRYLKEKFCFNQEHHILDYGCGDNQFIQVCRERGYMNSFGYDLYVDNSDDNYLDRDNCINQKWELISIWGVLEHVTDPVMFLRSIKKLLSDGGKIVLTTLFVDSVIPYQFKPPEHTLYFTRRSLESLMEKVGLYVVLSENYVMEQDSDVYMSILLRTMPNCYKELVCHNLPEFVKVPTNEILLILKK